MPLNARIFIPMGLTFAVLALALVVVGCSANDDVAAAAQDRTGRSATPSEASTESEELGNMVLTTRTFHDAPITEVCGYLTDRQMPTGTYKPDYAGAPTYFACSDYKELASDGALKNNLAYYVYGPAERASQLKLVLNVNDEMSANIAHTALASGAEDLCHHALGSSLPRDVMHSIENGNSGEWTIGRLRVSLLRVEWPTGRGYELQFVIGE